MIDRHTVAHGLHAATVALMVSASLDAPSWFLLALTLTWAVPVLYLFLFWRYVQHRIEMHYRQPPHDKDDAP